MKTVSKGSKFNVGERVLCYEPDLTKARVVYDAKILKIECPETRSRSAKNSSLEFHYLVHFQGWSSTWDRYVTEEFLLKTTENNRALQKKLFREAEAARSESMKKRKKKSRESSVSSSSSSPPAEEDPGPSRAKKPKLEQTPPSTAAKPSKSATEIPSASTSSEDNIPKALSVETKETPPATSHSHSASPATSPTTPATTATASISPSSASALTSKPQKKSAAASRNRSTSQDVLLDYSENSVNSNPIKLSEDLKCIMEQEFYRITKRKVLQTLPANPNVASVLEDYVKHYAAIRLVNYEKQLSKTIYTVTSRKTDLVSGELFNKVVDSINMAKEIADSLRIMFDFNLKSVLLYGSHGERKQYKEVMRPGNVIKRSRPAKDDCGDEDLVYLSPPAERRPSINEFPSSRSSTTSGRTTPSLSSLNPPVAASPTSPQAIKVLRDLHEWRLVPDSFYEDPDQVPMESLVYGPSHLLRLFVKMPEILGNMTIPCKTKKIVMKYLDSVLEYLNSHIDLFEN